MTPDLQPIRAETPAHTCRNHRWNHTGHRTPESACTLAKRRFGCPFRDATKCPDYTPKERSEKA